MPELTVLRVDALPGMPWKNGGGTTRELAVFPAGAGFDDFVWRVSVADVAQSGPFSALPGVDREIVLLEGEGMLLHGEHLTHPLVKSFEPHAFAGETPVEATLCGGATRDLNLMTRRGAAHGRIAVWRGAQPQAIALESDALLVYCAAGSTTLRLDDGPSWQLRAGDMLHVPAPTAACRVQGGSTDAVLVAAVIQLAPAGEEAA
ncbi:MAG: HutD family protein [Burkholderiales bacterium]|nr:HutD family protein [Burkholderiales bacterium]